MSINTEYLERYIQTTEQAYKLINQEQEGSINYEMYRNALVKGFEMTLELSGKLLRKKLAPYFASKKAVDALTFKDLYRNAYKHSLIDENTVERWLKYRDNRNNTAHDYGKEFAEETLVLIKDFISDAKDLKSVIEND